MRREKLWIDEMRNEQGFFCLAGRRIQQGGKSDRSIPSISYRSSECTPFLVLRMLPRRRDKNSFRPLSCAPRLPILLQHQATGCLSIHL